MISEQLLQTKLQIPRRRTPAVARSCLIERLNNGLESRLILISAPAGFGKTTLLTEWISSGNYPATWLSLDENENVPTFFIAYFIAALQKLKTSLGQSAPGLFNPSQQSPICFTEAALQRVTPTYTHRLIAAFPISDSRKPRKSIKMEEPLSDRELSVLALIAQGLSNKEIGDRLYIESCTVKWHTSNILGKLGVKNRTQAVARARELGILQAE